MNNEEKKQLKLLAVDIRKGIMTSTHAAKSGHPGGSLSAADIVCYLYFRQMRIDAEHPDWPMRDRFVLSKGHGCPAVYAALAIKGFFAPEELSTLRKIGSILQGHPNMNTTPGIDMSTGSLGQGVSVATGMAKGAKHMCPDVNVYVLCGDGELAEGIVWEAMMFANKYQLDNLCLIVDVNGLQIDGKTEDVMPTEPLADKFTSFGFTVANVDGHDFDDLERGFESFKNNRGTGKPFAMLCRTLKGKGVAYMEEMAGWHGKAPNDSQYEIAMAELNAHRNALEVL